VMLVDGETHYVSRVEIGDSDVIISSPTDSYFESSEYPKTISVVDVKSIQSIDSRFSTKAAVIVGLSIGVVAVLLVTTWQGEDVGGFN
jgi:hypothetical protein